MSDLANLLTHHRMSGLPIRSKYKHFKTNCEQTSDSSPTDSNSSCLNDGHPNKELGLCTIALSFCLPVHSFSQRTFSDDLSYRVTIRQFLRGVSRDSNNLLLFVNTSFVRLAFTLSASEIHVVKK